MPITCPGCGEEFEADASAGEAVCPRCGHAFDPRRVAETMVAPPPRPGEMPSPDKAAERTFSRYKILAELGRGGMGIVYKTYDPKLKRVVALKVLLAGEAASGDEVERFFREAESAASLHHPNIVPIHELDIHEGKHFFTMDFVEGTPLDKLIDRGPLDPRRAMELVGKIAGALHSAHEQGIVHRDVKPSNVIVRGDPDEGEPLVMDFGLAKQVKSESSLTQSGVFMGTPDYASPEQAAGRTRDLDARSDTFSLGSMFYEMLTGRLPFVGRSVLETLNAVVKDDPAPPRLINPRIPRDAEVVCLKCLEKDRARRYGSAADLADDCRRFLEGEAIAARPASVVYRVRKRLARHRAVTAVTAVAAVALLTLAVSSYVTVVYERNQAIREKEKADYELYVSNIRLAHRYWKEGNVNAMALALEVCSPRHRNWEWGWLHGLLRHKGLVIESRLQPVRKGWRPGGIRVPLVTVVDRGATQVARAIESIAVSPDGRRIASLQRSRIRVWDAESGHELVELEGRASDCDVAWSLDGSRLAAAGGLVWDASTGRRLSKARYQSASRRFGSVAFSPDGAAVAFADSTRPRGPTTVVLKDGTGASILKTREIDGEYAAFVCFAPRGGSILITGGDGVLQLRVPSLETLQEICSTAIPGDDIGRADYVRLAPDGEKGVLVGRWSVRTFSLEKSEYSNVFLDSHVEPSSTGGGILAAISPDCARVAFAGVDACIHIFDVESGRRTQVLKGSTGLLRAIDFFPDNARIAAGSFDGTIRVWRIDKDPEARVFGLPGCDPSAFTQDGRMIAFTDFRDATVRFWDIEESQEAEPTRIDGIRILAVSRQGRTAAVHRGGSRLVFHDMVTGRELANVSAWAPRGAWPTVRLSPDGKRAMFQVSRDHVCIFDIERAVALSTVAVERIAHPEHGRIGGAVFSWDGETIAFDDSLWDVRSEERQWIENTDGQWLTPQEFSPDGSRLACLVQTRYREVDIGINIYDTSTGCLLTEIDARQDEFSRCMFSPDGRRIVARSEIDGLIHLYDAVTGRELLTFDEGGGGIVFSPDGMRIVTGPGLMSRHHAIRIYEADPWWEPGNPPKRPEPVPIDIKPVPEARPAGAGKDDERF